MPASFSQPCGDLGHFGLPRLFAHRVYQKGGPLLVLSAKEHLLHYNSKSCQRVARQPDLPDRSRQFWSRPYRNRGGCAKTTGSRQLGLYLEQQSLLGGTEVLYVEKNTVRTLGDTLV